MIASNSPLPPAAAEQIADYFAAVHHVLGAIPSQETLVMERFFDESGGMQLVLHSPFGNRINRAWGLALRKRFCRSFNFELQAAATDDAIVISLGTQHSFPLEDVFRYLNSRTVRDLLVQALFDAPMFTIRWRWNASRALAVPRQRGGRRTPAPLQRMESENLLAAVFPDQLACPENLVGDREVPDHPLVNQTINDCLTEAMDIEGLETILQRIEQGRIRCIARDLPEPSPLAHEILNARPYAFLDNAPLEERRTQAVQTRRTLDQSSSDGLGILDAAAIEKVQTEAWPDAGDTDELHDALLQLGAMTEDEVRRTVSRRDATANAQPLLAALVSAGRATRLMWDGKTFWTVAERIPLLQAVYDQATFEPALTVPPNFRSQSWEREEAIRELVRGRMEVSGPVDVPELAGILNLRESEIEAALLALESEGFVLRGRFYPGATVQEWSDRRLLARIHRLTLDRLRSEIQPVSLHEFQRFLFAWQRVDAAHRVEGPDGLAAVLELLDGCELPVAAWEPHILGARLKEYDPTWLDRLCTAGQIGWGRLTPPQNSHGRLASPLRSSPTALFQRQNLDDWLGLIVSRTEPEFSPDTQKVRQELDRGGALFFLEIIRRTGLLPIQVEQALAELAATGLVTADTFDGLRALLIPADERPTLGRNEGRRHRKTNLANIEFAGRWSLLRQPSTNGHDAGSPPGTGRNGEAHVESLEKFARALLHRYGIVFRRLLEREALPALWYELGRIYRRWEARGEIRGGYFVSGVSGEQFALPGAIGQLRSIRKTPPANERIVLSGADPLNLVGILTPGPRVAALAANRILFLDGLPIAALEAGNIRLLTEPSPVPAVEIESALKIGKLPATLRPYYG
jgi:ATP-dependent Lhr-like helicase